MWNARSVYQSAAAEMTLLAQESEIEQYFAFLR
jgi:hypothetical protein